RWSHAAWLVRPCSATSASGTWPASARCWPPSAGGSSFSTARPWRSAICSTAGAPPGARWPARRPPSRGSATSSGWGKSTVARLVGVANGRVLASARTMFESIDDVIGRLAEQQYISSRAIGTVVYLASRLEKPILVEGPAGVGKTELAKVVAAALRRELI